MKKFAVATGILTLIVVVALFVKRGENNQLTDVEDTVEGLAPETKKALDDAKVALDDAAKKVTTQVGSEQADETSIPEEGMVMTEEQMQKLEAYFEKVEKDWADRMNQLFVRELSLDSQKLTEYFKMREGYEQDKLDAFEDFHEEMIEKYGENYSYKPSEEEKLFTAKVRERYEAALIKLIGEEAYTRYIEVRDQFNRELSEIDDRELGFIKVDF